MSELRELDQQVAQSLMGWVWYNANGHSMLVPKSLPESFDTRWMREHIADRPTHEKRILIGLDFRAGISLPHYSDEIAAAFKVEDRIAELGLHVKYLRALIDLAVLADAEWQTSEIYSAWLPNGLWPIVHASPEQRCRAALEAVKEKAKATSG